MNKLLILLFSFAFLPQIKAQDRHFSRAEKVKYVNDSSSNYKRGAHATEKHQPKAVLFDSRSITDSTLTSPRSLPAQQRKKRAAATASFSRSEKS